MSTELLGAFPDITLGGTAMVDTLLLGAIELALALLHHGLGLRFTLS